MKKTTLSAILIAAFTLSCFQMAFAKPGKSQGNSGQIKKQTEAKEVPKAKKETVPPVIKAGKLNFNVAAIQKGFKAEVAWDKATNTITLTKGDVKIEFVGDSKVLVNGAEVSMSLLTNGSGKIVPGFLQQILNGNTKTLNTTSSAITTGSAVTTGSAATTGSAVTTDSAITTDSGITITIDGK